ncbi:hypothetical protein QTP70_025755 [Hemibagrus guttatus]|uniref:Complement component C8 beta chain n=1 Tax=Hemibagrus guttatus TaxID=175788 RepID=A0AAE0R830_9TELE|nr:hypothetical protein QTP70_025755 [Hemibagrus guttatus]
MILSTAALHASVLCAVVVVCRSQSQPPLNPVECSLSEWTQWTRCDPCLKKRFRSATVLQPSQFGGEPCHELGREEESCTPPPRYLCRSSVPLCQGFQCPTTGRCVPEGLRCNGDDDCGDSSDELNCKKVFRACDQPTEEYYGIENLGKGINVLNSNFGGVVLDNRYYAGGCLPHFIQDVRYRKPYNIQQYTLEASLILTHNTQHNCPQRSSYDYKLETFDSYKEFSEHTMKATMSRTTVSFSFAVPGVFNIGFNYDESKYKKSVQKLSSYAGKTNSFVHAHVQLEVARYALKVDNLMLHPEFLTRLRALPLEYTYGEYRELFSDYGTHYITEATLGGSFDHTLILNKENIQKSKYSLNDAKSCLQAGFKIGATIKGVYVSAGAQAGSCEGLLKELGDSEAHNSLVEDYVSVVRGGDSETVSSLAAKQLPTPDIMQLWGDAVYHNPDYVSTKMAPLYELVTGKDFTNANMLKKNLKRAMMEFLSESDSCRCSPCLNNGRAVLKGTRCECICPNGFRGLSCEDTKRSGMPVDGNWSCWSEWSACTGGTKKRTRQCNNPAPQNGGSSCQGKQEDSTDCF